VLLLAAGGVALAVALTRGGHAKASTPPQKVTVVHTITQPGTTVVSTAQAPTPPPTTAAAPPTTQPTTTQASTQPASGDPVALNNQAYELMKQGDYTHALPLLESAVSQMQGSGSLANAYANYNLGVTLMQLGRCADAMPYLETSKSLQPGRKEVLDAIKQARTCSG
jgi:TolA-binding protein